ncbi:hypothetical protein LCGC14_0457070 [marine sediment metagenome]|uniref:Uncharacterized protein n=1 Tax=marine sediment metagenome TaxID=412755 RepID=A0A0F9SGC7_9ZZZZ|nr:hypothetical protein [Candidatus Aminicenantes bacterium]
MSQIFKDSGGTVAPDVEFLTGDSGGPVPPDAAFNIDILGNPDIDMVGTPGTNSFQMTNLTKLTPFVVGAAGEAAYTTIQAALDAANAAGGGAVYIQPGSYTEDLTLYTNVSMTAAEGNVDTINVSITGTHTPPIGNGPLSFFHINFFGGSSIFFSAAAGEAYMVCETCNFILSSDGYVFDLDNWVGPTGLVTGIAGVAMANSGDLSIAESGFIKNSVGGMGVVLINSYIGALLGAGGTPMLLSGEFQMSLSDVFCPVIMTGGTGSFIEQCGFHVGTVTLGGTSSGSIYNCNFTGYTVAAIDMASSATWKLGTTSIDSSNDPAIDGTGAGTLELSGISFMDNANIAATVTLNKRVLEAGIGYFDNLSFDQGTSTVDTDGELIIGSTGNNPQISTLTEGTGITIINGPGSITIANTGQTDATGQTIGAVTDDVITFALGATAGTFTLEARVAGFESTGPSGCGYQLFGTVRTTGAAATLVGTPDQVANEDAVLAAADADIVVAGNNAIIRVTGVVALTLEWGAHLEITEITP